MILKYGFDELNLYRIELEVFAFNKRAIRAYEKVGFTHEGTRRGAFYREGVQHDVHLMSVLVDEWREENKGVG